MDSVAITLYLSYFDKIVYLEATRFWTFFVWLPEYDLKESRIFISESLPLKIFKQKKKKTTEKKNAFIAFIHLMKKFSAS